MIGAAALIPPLLAATLVVLTAVAGLPALLLVSRAPQPRHQQPGPQAGLALQLVRSAGGTWFLNGQPLAEEALGRLLRQSRLALAELRFRPSAALSAAEVASSMAWLHRQSARSVVLDLPGAAP